MPQKLELAELLSNIPNIAKYTGFERILALHPSMSSSNLVVCQEVYDTNTHLYAFVFESEEYKKTAQFEGCEKIICVDSSLKIHFAPSSIIGSVNENLEFLAQLSNSFNADIIHAKTMPKKFLRVSEAYEFAREYFTQGLRNKDFSNKSKNDVKKALIYLKKNFIQK